MKNICIINGPNLNLLGERETEVYGKRDWDSFYKELENKHRGKATLNYFQSNSEGELINAIQHFAKTVDGIIINPAGYTHSSVALADAIKAVAVPVYCVHISLVHKREEARQADLIEKYADGYLSGLGLDGYNLAIECLLD